MEDKNIIYTCEVCERKFNVEESKYSEDRDKCLLHCKKDTWYELKDNVKDWSKSEEKIITFWRKIRQHIKEIINKDDYKINGNYIDLTKIIFPKFESAYDDCYEEEPEHWVCCDWYDNFCDNEIIDSSYPSNNLQFINGFIFSNSIFLDDADFSNYSFKNILFKDVTFNEKCNFIDSKIERISFENCIFQKNTIFKNSSLGFYTYKSYDFEDCNFFDMLTFDNVTFYENKYKKLELDLKNSEFQELNILNTTFDKGLMFYGESSIKSLNIKDCKIKNLLIAADVPIINLDLNKKEINNFLIKPNNLKNLTVINSIINSDFLLNDEENNNKTNLDSLNLKESTFKGKVKIQFLDCIKDANFYNTKFEDLADFYRTKFYKVNFERTDFKNIAVFSESEFYCDVNFKYTKFLSTSIFRDTVITRELNLRDTIFKEDANFLDITSKSRKVYDERIKDFINIGDLQDISVSNRETARIIKNFFDSSNNIIEANRFYKLEMKHRENELEKSFEKGKNIFEYLIFKFHGLSSNHSQNPLLTFFWIYLFSVFYSLYDFSSKKTQYKDKFIFNDVNVLVETIISNKDLFHFIFFVFIVLTCFIIISVFNKYLEKGIYFFLIYFITVFYLFYTNDFCLIIIANSFNPFSIITEQGSLDMITLCYKIVMGYLIYQFIISIRQNTRRK